MMPTGDKSRALAELHASLGYGPLGRVRAKVEVLLGLFAAGSGLLLSAWAVSRPVDYKVLTTIEGKVVEAVPLSGPEDINWPCAVSGLALFVLGGYLALAGHRSYLDLWSNELASLLLEHLKRLEDRGQARDTQGITAKPAP
jgi:hypothetical protein